MSLDHMRCCYAVHRVNWIIYSLSVVYIAFKTHDLVLSLCTFGVQAAMSGICIEAESLNYFVTVHTFR